MVVQSHHHAESHCRYERSDNIIRRRAGEAYLLTFRYAIDDDIPKRTRR